MASQLMAWRARREDLAPADIGGRRSSGDRRWQILAAAVAASWLLPFALNAMGMDVLLIPVFILAIGSTVRVGGVLLDRLVVSAFLLCGAMMVLGLLASEWPWGLSPVPVSGVLLTGVSAAAWYGRRAPRLPWRVRGTDLIVLGTGGFVWHYLNSPLAGKGALGRLGYAITAEDRLTHLSLFDTIHRVGGYAFLHQDAARASVQDPTQAVYPEGSHLLLAWLDIFRTSSTQLGSMVQADNRYFTYILGAYAVLCATVVWAARWVGGTRLRGWRATAVCSAVAGTMIALPTALMIPSGFDSELIGLLFLVLAVALLMRSAMGKVEFALVAIAGLVTTAYAYNIYAAFVAAALFGALLVGWRRHQEHRLALYAAIVVGGLIALVPSVIMVLSKFDVQKQAVTGGAMIPMDRSMLVGLGLLALAVGVLPRNRQIGSVRTTTLAVLGGWVVLGAFGAYQIHETGQMSYYFEKLAVGGLLIALIAVGGVGYLLKPVARAERSDGLRKRLAEPLAGILVFAAALSLFGGQQWGIPSVGNGLTQWRQSELAKWAKGSYKGNLGPAAQTFATRDEQRVQASGSVPPVLTLYSNDGYANWRMTFYAQTMLHTTGLVPDFSDMLKVDIGGDPQDEQKYQDSLDHLKICIANSPVPPTILVADQKVAKRLEHDLNGAGTPKATILFAPLVTG